VEFDVRGLIQAGGFSRTQETYPKKISDIAIGFECRRLHFLHTGINAYDLADGTEIGSYVVHYSTGETHEIPIRVGREVADWWNQPNEENKGFCIAWSGTNEATRAEGRTIRLFKTAWENPLPTIGIKSIDLVASLNDPAPLLVAITGE
jgi:hypothetical protein